MAKKIIMFGLTFFGASSSNFFNKGLPNKILIFLSSVLIALSNDTTFVKKKKRFGNYLNIYEHENLGFMFTCGSQPCKYAQL